MHPFSRATPRLHDLSSTWQTTTTTITTAATRFPLPQRKRLLRFSDGNKSDRQTHPSHAISLHDSPHDSRTLPAGLRGKAFPAALQQEACITLRQLLDFLPITHHFAAPLNFHSRRNLHISRRRDANTKPLSSGEREREKKVEGERESERTNASPTSQMRDNISLGWGNALSKQESFSYSPLLSFDMDEICFDEISFLPGDVSQDLRRGGKLEPSPITFSTLTFLSSFPSARRE